MKSEDLRAQIQEINGRFILRDDAIPGGTKRRALSRMLRAGEEYVYAGPAYGYAQLALAYAADDANADATVFVAKRGELHPRTSEAAKAGAKVVQIPHGYLSNVQAKAKQYCEATGAIYVPFGVDSPEFARHIIAFANGLPIVPTEVWSVAGSGTLTRALQQAWPDIPFYAVAIGKPPVVGRATLLQAPEKFEQDAKSPPPFPSCSNYDAKAWRFFSTMAAPGALLWNVGR